MSDEQLVQIIISKKAANAVRRGHPWLYKEAEMSLVPGTVVQMIDPDRAVVGWGLSDQGPISVRILGRRTPERLSRVIADRIFRADRARLRLMEAGTDAYRVVHGAGDGLPGLVIDRYAGLAVVRLYSAAWELHLDRIVQSIQELAWVENIYRRFGVRRVDGRDGGEVLSGVVPNDRMVVQEHGMKLLVRPLVGQKTGMFIDQREHRRLVGGWAAGRVVANLFAYTGGFSVAAALGGAARVTTVDLAPDAVEDAKENFRLNGLDPDHHGFEVADAFAWEPVGAVGLLIVDPPALSRARDSDSAAKKAYRKLHRRVGGFVSRGGLLATSSCSSRVGFAQWQEMISEGLFAKGDWCWHWRSGAPVDHPISLVHSEANYLKFALLRRY